MSGWMKDGVCKSLRDDKEVRCTGMLVATFRHAHCFKQSHNN